MNLFLNREKILFLILQSNAKKNNSRKNIDETKRTKDDKMNEQTQRKFTQNKEFHLLHVRTSR